MTAALSALPADTPVYVDGYGVATLGELRNAPPEGAAPLSDWERTLNMYRDLAALNTNRQPWEPHVTAAEIRAFHGSRSIDDPPRLSST